MSGQRTGSKADGQAVPSQPLVDWLTQQYDQQTPEQHGPWASAWDGDSLAAVQRQGLVSPLPHQRVR